MDKNYELLLVGHVMSDMIFWSLFDLLLFTIPGEWESYDDLCEGPINNWLRVLTF